MAVNLPYEVALSRFAWMPAPPVAGVMKVRGRGSVAGYSSTGWHWMQPVGPVLPSFPVTMRPDISIFQSWVLIVLWQPMHRL